jgi:transcriptional regulator with XRE-family HTH domain
MEILAQRLRILRKEQKMRQEDVAVALGLSTNGYQRYELNQRDPDAPVLAAIADLFHVSADYLLGRKDER